MLELNKNIEDRHSYPLCPREHRWIYNKLLLAEEMGYYCAPSGCFIKKPGLYCMRPIMGFAGNGEGGFLKFHAKQNQTGIEQPLYRAGYFWCEWFTGWHAWTNFVNDKPVFECGGVLINNELIMKYDTNTTTIELPESLKGISKNMLVEHIGGHIIEVAPRRMVHETNKEPTKMTQVPDDIIGVCWRPLKIYDK